VESSVRGRINRTLAIAACVTVVPAAIAALVWWAYREPLSAFRPYINDEVTYWHQALTFGRVGFGGGFYTSSEITNPSGMTPFGAHGPGFPVLYGLFGSTVSWHLHTPVVINLAFIGLATWLCLALSRAQSSRTWLLCALLATFWPLLLWAPTAMQESLHHAGAIAMAGCMAGALSPPHDRTARVVGWPLLALLGFIRPSWLVLMPIWAVVSTWGKRPRAIALALGASVLVSLGLIVAYGRTAAPFVPPFFFLRATGGGIDVAALWTNTVANLSQSLALGEYEPHEILLRLQYWGWLAGIVLVVALLVRRRRHGMAPHVPHLVAGAASMAAALAFMLVLYTLTNAAEHRVLSAFLLLAVVLAALAPGRTGPVAAAALLASNVVTTPLFLHAFKEERQDNFVWDYRPQRELQAALAEGRVTFSDGEARWCNTLLTSQFPPFLTAVPAGIGLSVVREAEQLRLPVRSKYLLLDERALSQFARPPRVEPLASLPYGTLYRNLDAGCR
jgi:hypothetical protein